MTQSLSFSVDPFSQAIAFYRQKSSVSSLPPNWKGLRNPLGQTLLTYAISIEDKSLFSSLVQKKVSLLETDKDGNNGLHQAAKKTNHYFMKAIWQFFPINSKNWYDQTPLHCASSHNATRNIQLLLNSGAKSQNLATYTIGETSFSFTCLQIAVVKGLIETIDILLQHQFHLGYIYHAELGNLLHLSIQFSQIDAMCHLLDNYPKLDLLHRPNSQGFTPALLAAHLGNNQALIELKKRGVNLSKEEDLNGKNPLHLATLGDHQQTIGYLAYEYPSLLHRVDIDAKRPLDLIEKSKDPKIQETKNLLTNLLHRPKNFTPIFSYRPPENLVFKGGGSKGIAYIGAYQALEEAGYLRNLRRAAGTSAGAIFATLIAIGYKGKEIKKLLCETDSSKFLDHPFSNYQLSSLKDSKLSQAVSSLSKIYHTLIDPFKNFTQALKLLYTTTGLCEGKVLREWVEQVIYQKTNIHNCTFKELRQRQMIDLHVFATSLSNKEIAHFSSDNPKHGDFIIADVVSLSTRIPGIFEPGYLYIKKEGKRFQVPGSDQYVDGGMLFNFPITCFDNQKYQPQGGSHFQINPRTLGLSLFTSSPLQTLKQKKISTLFDLFTSISSIYLNAESILRKQLGIERDRTISIDNQGISVLDFSPSKKDKEKLLQAGREATSNFLKKQQKNLENLLVSPQEKQLIEGIHTLDCTHLTSEEEKKKLSQLTTIENLTIIGSKTLTEDNLRAIAPSKALTLLDCPNIQKKDLLALKNKTLVIVLHNLPKLTAKDYLSLSKEFPNLQILINKQNTRIQLSLNKISQSSLLHTVIEWEEPKLWEYALLKKCSVDDQAPENSGLHSGYPPLSVAAYAGNLKGVKFLLQNNASLSKTDSKNRTVLERLAQARKTEKRTAVIEYIKTWNRTN